MEEKAKIRWTKRSRLAIPFHPLKSKIWNKRGEKKERIRGKMNKALEQKRI